MGRLTVVLLIVTISLIPVFGAKEKCHEEVEPQEECSETEYESYVECMRKRVKRSLNSDCYESCEGGDCETSSECDDCDCSSCDDKECSNSCVSCCSNREQSCSTRTCCQKSCHKQCRSSNCRRNCRTRCNSKISSKPTQHSSSHVQSESSPKHNITTIINLHNVVNNTNMIDMPITINNTNVNNITLEAAEGGSGSQKVVVLEHKVEKQVDENCCKIIGPRQCMQTNTYPFVKCFHYRKTHCGPLCKTDIMHAEPHEVCDQTQKGSRCHQQITYIPQPQPRCSYTSTWPYVSCGIQNPNCGGCYKHVVQGGPPQSKCSSSCYDGGYNVGPMYRQGPVYQQSYSPIPPCAYTGTCGTNQMMMPMVYQNQYQPQPQVQPQAQYPNPYENYYQIEYANEQLFQSNQTDMTNENSISYPISDFTVADVQPEAEANVEEIEKEDDESVVNEE